jgi:replicative DNA helicase
MEEITSLGQNPESDGPFGKQPCNIEAEQQVLGALLLDNDISHKVFGFLLPGHFFDPVHARIYEDIVDLINAGSLASPITLKHRLANDEGLQALGGPAYLARLAGSSISSFAARDYAQMVIEAASKRRILDTIQQAVAEIQDGKPLAAEIATKVESICGEVLEATSAKPLTVSHLRVVAEAISDLNHMYQQDEAPGVSSGIADLDKMIGKLQPGEFYLVAGRPSMGKTTVAQNFIYNAASASEGVFFASLEMEAKQIGYRMFSRGLRDRDVHIPYDTLRTGRFAEAQFRDVVEEAKRTQGFPIIYAERYVRELSRLRAACRRAKATFTDDCPLRLIVVDYVQEIEVKGLRPGYETVTASAQAMKSIARELGVPVVGLAQLSRAVEQQPGLPVPNLSHLKESGKLEEAADVVIFCFRPSYYIEREKPDATDVEAMADWQEKMSRTKGLMDLIVAKNRNGAIGTVQCAVDMPTSYVGDLAKPWQQDGLQF